MVADPVELTDAALAACSAWERAQEVSDQLWAAGTQLLWEGAPSVEEVRRLRALRWRYLEHLTTSLAEMDARAAREERLSSATALRVMYAPIVDRLEIAAASRRRR